MTQQTNPAAEAAREAHRSRSTGRFQEHTHQPSAATLTAQSQPTFADLVSFADQQEDTEPGRRAANLARLSIAARRLEQYLPEAAGFVAEPSPHGPDAWEVARAWDTAGWKMGEDDRGRIMNELREAGVKFDGAPVDLPLMRVWTPEAGADLSTSPDPDDEEPTQKAVRRAFLALKAGDTDPPAYDPQVRLADALTDFRHYARQHGLNMEEAIRLSAEYHQNEVDEDELAQEESNA